MESEDLTTLARLVHNVRIDSLFLPSYKEVCGEKDLMVVIHSANKLCEYV